MTMSCYPHCSYLSPLIIYQLQYLFTVSSCYYVWSIKSAYKVYNELDRDDNIASRTCHQNSVIQRHSFQPC